MVPGGLSPSFFGGIRRILSAGLVRCLAAPAEGAPSLSRTKSSSSIDAWESLEAITINVELPGSSRRSSNNSGGRRSFSSSNGAAAYRRFSSSPAPESAATLLPHRLGPAPVSHSLALFDSDYGQQPPCQGDFERTRRELCMLVETSSSPNGLTTTT